MNSKNRGRSSTFDAGSQPTQGVRQGTSLFQAFKQEVYRQTRQQREETHAPYDALDVKLYRNYSLSKLETMMKGRNAPNELGAAYRQNDLSRPYSMAVQKGAKHDHAHHPAKQGPNSIEMHDLKKQPTNPNELSGMVVTHSHPGSNPLSGPDVMQAMKHDFSEIRAVGQKGAYSLRRPTQGWNYVPMKVGVMSNSSQSRLDLSVAEAEQHDLKTPLRQKSTNLVNFQGVNGTKEQQNFGQLRQHHAVRRFALSIGAHYEAPEDHVGTMKQDFDRHYPLARTSPTTSADTSNRSQPSQIPQKQKRKSLG